MLLFGINLKFKSNPKPIPRIFMAYNWDYFTDDLDAHEALIRLQSDYSMNTHLNTGATMIIIPKTGA